MNSVAPINYSPTTWIGRGHGIIPALDLPTAEQVRDIVAATADVDGVVGYKLGPSTVLELGLPAALRLVGDLTDLPVIYDHQKAGLDIPSNADVFARTLAAHGVSAAIVFPLAGPTTAAGFLTAFQRTGVAALIGGQLPVADYTAAGGGWIAEDVLDHIADIALEHGETQLIVPAGDRVEQVVARAAAVGVRPRLFVPGVGADGDELRGLAPVVAHVAGLFPIVGRAVIAADDPAAAAARLTAELDTVVTTAGGIR
ncbi:orotidine 5'-phosphate decarboxylase [Gordonia paraffinivorans]|uniref:orotidine 5'-phosphate decarboxylase / HUMPS family protein n=1 Tax=Gordonia paraffinivorans TaxID=175628 RepID=UPI001C92C1F0|nr:orotidine 5'-phosphate decarboxylase / HUMPS family protein [Gordonia paraffinivorans]MBY4574890.1 orotidine 5'-phosphate decarboxylase [Gordonia paraffinivorans]